MRLDLHSCTVAAIYQQTYNVTYNGAFDHPHDSVRFAVFAACQFTGLLAA